MLRRGRKLHVCLYQLPTFYNFMCISLVVEQTLFQHVHILYWYFL
jgi:hypothetical protein